MLSHLLVGLWSLKSNLDFYRFPANCEVCGFELHNMSFKVDDDDVLETFYIELCSSVCHQVEEL